MIVSRPQTNTLVSFGIFIALTLAGIGLNVVTLVRNHGAWYNYLIIALLVPIGGFVLYKIFIRYMIIRMGNNLVEIEYPILKKKEQYPIKSIVAWRENIIKTGKNSTYKQLEILFDNKKRFGIGYREQTGYTSLVQYLQRKAPGKRTPGA